MKHPINGVDLAAADSAASTQASNSEKRSWRDLFQIHPAAEIFPRVSDADLVEIGNDIRKHGLRLSIVMWRDPETEKAFVIDGITRLDACERVGARISVDDDGGPVIDFGDGKPIVRYRFTKVDPESFVDSANFYRRHLNAEQKREHAARLLKAQPDKSNRQIARAAKLSHHTIEAVRSDLEATGQIAQLRKTVGKDGRARGRKGQTLKEFEARKAKAKPPKPPDDDDTPGDSPEVIWRRGLKYRAEHSAEMAMYEDWSEFDVDRELVDLARQAVDAWAELTQYLESLERRTKTKKRVRS